MYAMKTLKYWAQYDEIIVTIAPADEGAGSFHFRLKKLNDQTANNHFLLIQDNNLSIYNKVKADP